VPPATLEQFVRAERTRLVDQGLLKCVEIPESDINGELSGLRLFQRTPASLHLTNGAVGRSASTGAPAE
jgi:hypothetical protein